MIKGKDAVADRRTPCRRAAAGLCRKRAHARVGPLACDGMAAGQGPRRPRENEGAEGGQLPGREPVWKTVVAGHGAAHADCPMVHDEGRRRFTLEGAVRGHGTAHASCARDDRSSSVISLAL